LTTQYLFLGRDSELATLRHAYAAVVAARGPRVALLRGEPGIGKTALMTQFLKWAADEGARTLEGGCTEVALVPYQPFIEALRGSGLEMPPRPSSGTDSDRFLFFNAVAAALATASETRNVVLALDDLHWADPHSLELLEHLVGSASLARVMVVGTYRDTDVVEGAGAGRRLGHLVAHPTATVIDVPGWNAAEIVDHVSAVLGHERDDAGALATALLRETDGNPFFVGELVRHIVESGRLPDAGAGIELESMRLPDSVREVVLARVARVGNDAMRVLSTAAVVGPRFDAALLASVAGIHPDAATDALERAAQVALVRATGSGQHLFTHALVRHALYDDLTAVRRSREHVRVGDVLERRFAEVAAEHAAELAHHFVAGRDSRAVEYARRAGEAALAALAPQDALRWYGIAFELSDLPADRMRALLGLGDAQRQAGVAEFRTTLLAAAELAMDLGDNGVLTAAALANSRGFASMTGAADDERVHVLEAAVGAIKPDDKLGGGDRARLLALLALELGWGYDATRLRELSDEALAIARATGDPAVVRDVLARRVMAIWSPASLAERLANTSELERTSRVSGDVIGEFWACFYRVAVSLEAGDGKELRRCFARANQLADEVGQPLLRWTMQVTNSWVTLLDDEVEAAEALANDALETATQLGQADALPIYAALLFGIRWRQGRLAELIRLMEAGVRNFPDMPTYQATLAWTYSESGRVDDARPLLRAALERGFAAPELVWLVTAALWAHVAATAGDTDAAGALYELLLPWREQTVFSGANAHGPVAYYLGRLAKVIGRPDDARLHLEAAIALANDIGAPFFRELAQRELA
jgi:tetratricopeptide (TPR) repeat protein